MKNLKKKKGFTLIELIVVIAILGILAAVAVPRMAGFTDKAKIAADKEYGNLIAHATQTLIADGTYTTGGTLNVDSTGTVTSSGAGTSITGFTAGSMTALVPVKPLQKYTSITIVLNIDGTYTITYA